MTDIVSSDARSRNMSAIKNRDTVPEIVFRHGLFRRGYRYRKNVSHIPGHPDLYLARFNTAIFIHGCFWHRHPGCKYAYSPKTRISFWSNKFESNIRRDLTVRKMLETQKIRCLIVWECTVKKTVRDTEAEKILYTQVEMFFRGSDLYMEL